MSKPNIEYRNLIRNQLQPKPSRKETVIFFILILILLLFAGWYYYSTYYQNKPQYVLPPKYNTENQTYNEVITFIKSDNTDTIQYGEGFNCVDSVYRVFLNARWQGIAAVPVAIQYEEPPGHMVIGFPTVDKDFVFFETENDQRIYPIVGQNYNGKKVRGFYYLAATWVPLANSPEYDTSIEIK